MALRLSLDFECVVTCTSSEQLVPGVFFFLRVVRLEKAAKLESIATRLFLLVLSAIVRGTVEKY